MGELPPIRKEKDDFVILSFLLLCSEGRERRGLPHPPMPIEVVYEWIVDHTFISGWSVTK
jgi:hypothetical protein